MLGGAHNWGKPEDQVKLQAEVEGVAPAASPAPEDAAEETPAVQEEPQLTLDEFQAQQAAKRVGPAFAEKQVRQIKAEVVGKVCDYNNCIPPLSSLVNMGGGGV